MDNTIYAVKAKVAERLEEMSASFQAQARQFIEKALEEVLVEQGCSWNLLHAHIVEELVSEMVPTMPSAAGLVGYYLALLLADDDQLEYPPAVKEAVTALFYGQGSWSDLTATLREMVRSAQS